MCQEIFSSELPFAQHRKQLLSELVRLEGFITLTDFQFKFPPIDIIHRTRTRKKMRQSEKVLLLALISFLSLNRLCPKSVPETHYYIAKFPWNPLFLIFFCGKYCPGLLNAAEPHYFLLFLSENNAPDQCPGPHYIWLRLPLTPLFFIFLDKKFCPGLLRTCPGLGPGHRHPPLPIGLHLRAHHVYLNRARAANSAIQ